LDSAGPDCTTSWFFAVFFLVATTSTVGKVTVVCAEPIPPRQQSDVSAELLNRSTRPIRLDMDLAVTPHSKITGLSGRRRQSSLLSLSELNPNMLMV
jgi:hypothetical protein